jgi:hypothetical protein
MAAAGNKAITPFAVHLLADGTQMELAGGMPDGTAEAVRKVLEAHPDIRVIHLNNEGGEMSEGYLLAKLIRQHHLTTYTASTCSSACTLAFLAGSPRYLAQNAWLGFHSASRTLGGTSLASANDVLRQLYDADGLPRDFIDRALATAPSELWYPTHDELRAAHAVSDIVDAKRFAKSGLAYWTTAAELDQALKKNALYAAISAHDSANYAQIQKIYMSGAKSGHNIAEIDAVAEQLVIGQLVPHYIRQASDDAVLRYQRVQIAQLSYLQQSDPTACAAEAFPALGITGADYQHVLPQSIKKDSLDALAGIATSAFAGAHAVDDPGEAHAAMTDYVRHLYRDSPAIFTTIREPARSRNDPVQLCNAATQFLRGVLDRPAKQAAIIVRDLMGSNS